MTKAKPRRKARKFDPYFFLLAGRRFECIIYNNRRQETGVILYSYTIDVDGFHRKRTRVVQT